MGITKTENILDILLEFFGIHGISKKNHKVDAVILNLRRHLLDMGLTPKTVVTVRKRAPLGDPIELRLRGYELTLRAEDAREITIEPLEEGKNA